MAYLLLFTGLFLVGGSIYGLYCSGFLNWEKKNDAETKPKLSLFPEQKESELAQGLQKLTDAIEKLSHFLGKQYEEKEDYFSEILEEKIYLPSGEMEDEVEEKRMEKIYRKYQEGLNLVELSQEFKKSKGEVQLILNLMEAKQKKINSSS